MDRRAFFAGAATLGTFLLAPAAQAKVDKGIPNGRPFQALQRQIDALRRKLLKGEFRQVTIDNPNGADRLLFGPTDLCTVEVDPDGPPGLLLRDPNGVRILSPEIQEPNTRELAEEELPKLPPRLLFGPTDTCQIQLGSEGLIVLDPFGLNIQNPDADQPNVLAFGDRACRIEAGGVDQQGAGFGMIFTDPEGFGFQNDVAVEGLVVAEGFEQTSSGRLKQNVRPIDDALDKINALQGVYFDWKPEKGGKPDVGFVGEDVGRVLPELVTWDDEHKSARGVKYANLVAVAIEGIKEQHKQVERLQTENAALHKEMQALQSRLSDLSAKVERLTG